MDPIAIIGMACRFPGAADLRGFWRLLREGVDAIREVKEKIIFCSVCNNLTDTDPCRTCADEGRDHASICVVEEPHNLVVIEKSGQFRGLYHVLHGSLSPLKVAYFAITKGGGV